MPRKRKNNYFTKEHENAIIAYAKSESKEEKTELYVKLIQPAFDEMVEKIVYTYKFNLLPNIDYLKEDCKLWLTTILDKYNPNKNSKAFSYFSVITKNWFIAKIKKNKKASLREVSYESLTGEGVPYPFDRVVDNPYERHREQTEFFSYLRGRMDRWENDLDKDRDRKVIQAIQILFDSAEEIEIFNKKAIYLYIREITGLNTKQIVSTLTKVRLRYGVFKKSWDEGEIDGK
jgi:hypothetical protein